MGLEAANFIAGLDESWPTGLDPVNKGDDHIRLVKQVLKGQFPGSGGDGYSVAIDALEDDLNNTTGSTGNFQAQIDALTAALDAANAERSPVGGVIMYNGLLANIPVNWAICDGTNGTPDLVGRFVYGTVVENEILDVGGSANAVVVSHSHSASSNVAGNHNHTYKHASGDNSSEAIGNETNNGNFANQGSLIAAAGDHSHTITVDAAGVSGTNANLPPYIKLAYIQRIS